MSMNKLPLEKRVQILSMLCEGSSMRSISRVCDVSINTVTKLLVDAGRACAAFHDAKVRGLKSQRDTGGRNLVVRRRSKEANCSAPRQSGDARRRVDVDGNRCRYQVDRHGLSADRDYRIRPHVHGRPTSRLANRVQLTSDGLKTYFYAVQGDLRRRCGLRAAASRFTAREPEGEAPLQPGRLHRRREAPDRRAIPTQSTSARHSWNGRT